MLNPVARTRSQMPKKDSQAHFEQFTDTLSLLWDDQFSAAGILTENLPLQNRYLYDAQIGAFLCKGKKKFEDYIEKSPEKDFFALLNPNDPQLNLAQYLSESDLVHYYLIYCWAADFAHKHKLGAGWQQAFAGALQQKICDREKRRLDKLVLENRPQWSVAKNKLYTQLVQNTEQIPLVAQRTHYYHQLANQAKQKHFFHDGTKQHVFYNYNDAVSRYEYESLMQELSDILQPILYYPESVQQQANLREYARHCFFVDPDTQALHYINTMGTVFLISETALLAKTIKDIKPVKGKKWMIPYEKTKTDQWHFEVEKRPTSEYGTAFTLDAHKISLLLPEGFPQDPIIKLAESTVKKTKAYYYSLQRTMSLFGQDHILAFQQRIAGLVQTKEMLQGKTTREVRQTHSRPNMADYMGRGRNTYVFFDHPTIPEKSEFWHVDRSSDTPVLTQFPMDEIQSYYLNYMFSGAKSEAFPDLLKDTPDVEKWYKLGQKAHLKKHLGSEGAIISLDGESARRIPELLLSDMKIYNHLLEDRTYFETSNELVNLIETTKRTPENTRLLERCQTIHTHLELIAKDRLRSFPKSRGIVPPAKRQKIMQMMMEVIRDKNSPEATHYFRNDHTVYKEVFDPNQLDQYEPASFVWDGGSQLCYLDEQKKKVDVEMTDSIRRKLQKITNNPDPKAHVISANDVYDLMTRPRLFYYYCGVPIGLDFRWFDYTYYIPLKFDRSKGLHTGTAQEMIRDIHEQKLAVMNLLYKLGEMIVLMVVPVVLAAFGIAIPYHLLLGKLGAIIVEWIMIVWNVEFTFNYLRYTLLMNDLAHPELNQLDSMIKELNADVEKMSSWGAGFDPDAESNDLEDDSPLMPKGIL